MKTEQKAGKCPKCGAELEYPTGGELCDDFVAYNFECPECGLTGTEDHELAFSGFTLDEDDEEEGKDDSVNQIIHRC
jgi:predicted nucleic-acid-binding Zn-ribbon protein